MSEPQEVKVASGMGWVCFLLLLLCFHSCTITRRLEEIRDRLPEPVVVKEPAK